MRGIFSMLVICGLTSIGCSVEPPAATQYKQRSTSRTGNLENQAPVNNSNNSQKQGESTGQLSLAERGEKIFSAQCLQCHDAANGGINILNLTEDDINQATTIGSHSIVDPWPKGEDARAVEAYLVSD